MRTGSVTERIATTKRIPAAHFMEASEGDHDEVGQVLINSFRTLDRERFYNSLLDPDYKPGEDQWPAGQPRPDGTPVDQD